MVLLGHAYIVAFVLLSMQLASVLSAVFYEAINEPLYCTTFMDRYQRYHSLSLPGRAFNNSCILWFIGIGYFCHHSKSYT
jgi:hypothetical protein